MIEGNIATYIECDCHSREHLLQFYHDTEDNSLIVSTHLSHWQPWYKRVWIGIRYVFGGKVREGGDFDCTLISGNNLVKVRDLCDHAILARNKQLENHAN
jgi:hypothetical protein